MILEWDFFQKHLKKNTDPKLLNVNVYEIIIFI